MSLSYVVDGETDLDSALFNPIIDRVNGDAGPLANMRAGVANVLDYSGTAKAKLVAALADAESNGGVVRVPPGTYALGADPQIVIPAGISIIGAGRTATTFTFSSGTAFMVGDGTAHADYGGISTCTIDGPGEGVAGTVALHLREARFGYYHDLGITDSETGVLIDGEDQWSDGNTFDKPNFVRTKFGVHITADSSYQSNNNRIVDGGIYGNSPKTSGGIGVWIERGDSNVVFGTDIEDYETAVRFSATDAGGNSAVVPRIENCTNDIVIDSNVVNTLLVGHKNPAIGGNGQMTQYGSRLQTPVEDVSVLGEDAFYYRGVLARVHSDSSTRPDQLHMGFTRVDGSSVWGEIPILNGVGYRYLTGVGLHPANVTDATALASGDVHLIYLGTAPQAITTCDVQMMVTTAAASITWAEVAMYRGDSTNSVRRCGYTDVSATFNSTGQKSTTVALSDVAAGDTLWVAYGSSAVTPFQVRACLPDAIESGVFRTLGARPSTTTNFANPSNQWATSGVNPAWVTVRV